MTKSAGPALRQLHEEFGDRISFVALYAREAHPGDRDVQPEDYPTKAEQARAYADRDHIPWPVLIDDIESTLPGRWTRSLTPAT